MACSGFMTAALGLLSAPAGLSCQWALFEPHGSSRDLAWACLAGPGRSFCVGKLLPLMPSSAACEHCQVCTCCYCYSRSSCSNSSSRSRGIPGVQRLAAASLWGSFATSWVLCWAFSVSYVHCLSTGRLWTAPSLSRLAAASGIACEQPQQLPAYSQVRQPGKADRLLYVTALRILFSPALAVAGSCQPSAGAAAAMWQGRPALVRLQDQVPPLHASQAGAGLPPVAALLHTHCRELLAW